MVEQKKNVIYVPYWIIGALQRNNKPESTILDYRQIAKFLSAQEQANMLLFEDFNPFKEKIVDGRRVPAYGMIDVDAGTSITESGFNSPLYEKWRACVANSHDANDNVLFKNLETLNALSWTQSVEQEVAMRFDPANAGRISVTEPFITYDVEREFMLVVIYPAFFDSDQHSKNVLDLCRSVLKVLYVYNTPASGCKTPYFRKYLESLV